MSDELKELKDELKEVKKEVKELDKKQLDMKRYIELEQDPRINRLICQIAKLAERLK